MFGDNESVVRNSTVPHSQLKKRHVALSYHRVREGIAADIVLFHHVRSEVNPADILSKHWGFTQVWKVLKPLLFWHGDTSEISEEIATKPKQAKGGLYSSHQTGGTAMSKEAEPVKALHMERS